jgi:hypothetical protein
MAESNAELAGQPQFEVKFTDIGIETVSNHTNQ